MIEAGNWESSNCYAFEETTLLVDVVGLAYWYSNCLAHVFVFHFQNISTY